MGSTKRPWHKKKRLFLAVYLLLLLASHCWQLISPGAHPLAKNQKMVEVQAVAGDSLLPDRNITIAYRDEYRGTAERPPVVVLLHGSPIGVPMFSNLMPKLSEKFRVIAPDMPGYDASTRNIPDYSIRSYAFYTKQLIDSLNVNSVHLVGYSLGGGVALNMAHFYPERVESLGLISSIGVQELELLGSYTLNHAIHGVQLSLIWLLQEAVPHFGTLADFPLTVPYARGFYDSDQRPLRSYLQSYKKPMLIQHGAGDELVPLVAAQEHHRIVPQSKLITYNGGHGLVRSKADVIAEDLTRFVYSVENGRARTFSEASEVRINEAKRSFKDIDFEEFKGLTLAIIMLLIVMATFISEDLTCIGAGLMAARGLIGFWPAVIACFAGIFIGDVSLYLAGRWLGRRAVRRWPLKWFLSEEDLDKSEKWFRAKGPAIIIASRFLPGSRLPTYFSAGVVGAGFWMFISYFLLACIIWTPLLVGLSMLIGTELIAYFEAYQHYALAVIIGIVVFVILMLKVIIPAFSYRGRRLLISKWQRLKNWEFWPPSMLYFPVCFYVVYLWFKFKKLTVFTAANPAIPDGGFIGESKKQILDLFKPTGKVAPYEFIDAEIPAEDQFEKARRFVKQHALKFPVVIKPNEGQRGKGVKLIDDYAELKNVISASDDNLIIQQHIPGREFGVFYYRYPDEENGRLLSVTTKKLLTLAGDGERTIEELILEDDRAVCLAKKHLEYHQDHLYKIPGKGETIQLVDFGTHARGALFADGSDLITPELSRQIDAVCRKVGGIYFGRFDIRTLSTESLKKGDELHIIEFNGVTSEDTSIYDSENSFWDAQKKLMKQWRIVFEIGEKNAENGVPCASAGSIIKKMIRYKKK